MIKYDGALPNTHVSDKDGVGRDSHQPMASGCPGMLSLFDRLVACDVLLCNCTLMIYQLTLWPHWPDVPVHVGIVMVFTPYYMY